MNLVRLVDIVFNVYIALIFARVILSWIKHNPYAPGIRFIYEVTEPVMRFFRKLIPSMGVIDISPMVALFALYILRDLVIGIIIRIM